MIYYKDEELILRTLTEQDIDTICEEKRRQGRHPDKERYMKRIHDMENGKSYAIAAEYKGIAVGYINLLFKAVDGPFEGIYPEIYDFGINEKYRRKGIGSKMMDVAEALASERSDIVCLAKGTFYNFFHLREIFLCYGQNRNFLL